MEFKKLRKQFDRASIRSKIRYFNSLLNVNLKHIGSCSYDTELWRGNIENPIGVAQVPIGVVGPIRVDGLNAKGDFYVPLATTEGAIVLTYDLGARLLFSSGPVNIECLSKVIHITPMFLIEDEQKNVLKQFVENNYNSIRKIAESGSSHTRLLDIEHHHVAKNYLLKFLFDTADAQGLNMINKATFHACQYISDKCNIPFYHRSGFSGIKHYSSYNEIRGQGRRVKAYAIISKRALGVLRVTAQELNDFICRGIECAKAAGISCLNVQASNAIAAIFLACGQDIADLATSHACKIASRVVNNGKDLYFEIELPNLIVGTVGGGTGLPTQKECLNLIGCYGTGKSDKFAEIIAATVLAGEFPTAAAVVNKSYIYAHEKYGRNQQA